MEEIIDQLSLNLQSAINTKKIIKKFGGWTGSDIKIKDDLISTYGFGATSESFEYATDIIFDQKSISVKFLIIYQSQYFLLLLLDLIMQLKLKKIKIYFLKRIICTGNIRRIKMSLKKNMI